jgi:hypothetical protein
LFAIGETVHQPIEIGTVERAGAGGQACRAFQRQGKLARRHGPEIGGPQPE